MTLDERIKQLEADRDYFLDGAHEWIEAAQQKPEPESGAAPNITMELNEWAVWMGHAQRINDMLVDLKAQIAEKPPAVPIPEPRRRRALDLS